MHVTNIFAIFIAVLSPVVLAIVNRLRGETPSEYVIANRSIGPLLGTYSMVSVLGAMVLLGQSALAFQQGMGALWLYIGFGIGLFILGMVAPSLHRYGKKHGHISINEFIRLRAGSMNAGLSTFILFLIYIAWQLGEVLIGGQIIATLSGMSFLSSVILLNLAVLFYLQIGGLKISVLTDYIQFFMFVVTAIVVLFFLPPNTLHGTWSQLLAVQPLDLANMTLPGLAVLSAGDMMLRIFAARDGRTARQICFLSIPFFVFLGFVFSALGLAAIGLTTDPNAIFPVVVEKIFPSWLQPFTLIMMFALIMSTIDTNIFYLSASFVRDFHLFHPTDDAAVIKRQLQWVMPVITIGTAFLAFLAPNIVTVLFVILNLGTILGLIVLSLLLFRPSRTSVFLGQALPYAYFAYLLVRGIDPATSMVPLVISAVSGMILGELVERFSRMGRHS